ncbi:DNA cytosine methyltransferase [Actinomycetes bacterium M1A6_2h]
MADRPFTVVDLFSGGGGMSYGFHAHPSFDIVGAVDAQLGKPSSRRGSLACNSTYALNMGIEPLDIDLAAVEPAELAARLGMSSGRAGGRSGASGKAGGRSGASGKAGGRSGASGKAGGRSGASGKAGGRSGASGKAGGRSGASGKAGGRSGASGKAGGRSGASGKAGGRSGASGKAGGRSGATVDVLSACPPCTGFSRTNSRNHLVDDVRNALVPRVALFAEQLRPSVVVMENARELLSGNFREHFDVLKSALTGLGYTVDARVRLLSTYGLPQIRERALIVATRDGLTPRSLDDLWDGYWIPPDAVTVKNAVGQYRSQSAGEQDPSDPAHVSPRFVSEAGRERIAAIPHDGGSWRDLLQLAPNCLTPAMVRLVDRSKLGSFPDVYGRMAWNKPAPTIKRECGHVGNGRYAHPVDDRLCSLREMAVLNGFPHDYLFGGGGLANRYRHVGDAVPPLISYQIAAAARWSLTGQRPDMADVVLPNTSLRASDIRRR